jgi:hypothetical protein
MIFVCAGLVRYTQHIVRALASLEIISLYHNQIGDDGMMTIADVLCNGGLASLTKLSVDDGLMEHPALSDACMARGIDLT